MNKYEIIDFNKETVSVTSTDITCCDWVCCSDSVCGCDTSCYSGCIERAGKREF